MLDFVVRATDGSVDVDASTAKFLDGLAAFTAAEVESNEAIGAAVRAVFAKNLTAEGAEKTIPKPDLRVLTCVEMGLSPIDKSKHEAFDAFLASNPLEFNVSSGRTGGVKHVLPTDGAAETAAAPVATTKPKKGRKVA